MASDTVPAAADGPNTPPGNAPTTAAGDPGATPSGGFAGLLAPVQAARPAAFNLDPNNTLPGDATTPDTVAAGITSATFHNTPAGAGNSSTETVTQRQQQGVLRAFALAAAERWRKGADARLKALDVQKEKAKKNQVKTSATVNRSEKILGGSTHTGSSTNNNSGKSLDNKTRQHNSGNGGGTSNNGSGGRGGNSGGRGGNGGGRGHDGHSGGTGSGGGRGGAGRERPFRRDGSGNSDGSRSSNDSASRRRHDNNGTGSGTGGRGNSDNGHGREHAGRDHSSSGTGTRTNNGGSSPRGAQGPAGPTGGRGPSGDNTRTPAPDHAPRTPNGTGNGAGTERRPDAPQRVHRPGDSSGRPWRTNPDRPDRAGNQTPDNQRRPQTPERTDTPRDRRTPDRADRDRRTQPAPPAQDKVSLEKNDPTAQTPGTGRQDQNGQRRQQRPTDRPRTQGSRETGYRDGARAGAAANHVIAYRDGVRDGWNDQRAHGRREAEQLNQAHTDRRQQAPQPQPQPHPQQRPQPQEIPPMPTEPPTNGPAQPISVTNANASHIELGNGAARQFVSRGEVRNLAGYQRALDRKSINMARVAEHTLIYERHANAQAQRAMKLLEQARTVKGGDKLLRTLTRLAEAARAQEIKAAQAHKRAQRANESCRVLYANVDTRYSEIFKAAVDSADGPAELAYYRDLGMEPTNG